MVPTNDDKIPGVVQVKEFILPRTTPKRYQVISARVTTTEIEST